MIKSTKKIPLWSLLFVILSIQFSFSNIANAYYQMSYASMIWYVLGAVTFLFPLILMFAEYSGSIRNDTGGVYSWLINSIGEKWAFIGTFIWIGLCMINLLNAVSGMGINISEIIFGTDLTGKLHLGALNSNEVEAIIGIALIIIMTYLATKSIKNIAVTATLGGIFSISIIAIFIGFSIIALVANHGQLAQPIHGISSFIKSPNPQFQSPVAIMSFIVYAIFAYGGAEATSGMIDKLKNPRKTFPKAMIYSAVIMTVLYLLGIFICGITVNWNEILSSKGVNLYNVGFVLMSNLGVVFAKSLGLSAIVGKIIGGVLVRFLAIGTSVAMLGFLIVIVYSPVKGLIAGSSKDLWPKKITRFNKYNMPSRAMWIQCAILVIALAFISMTGQSGQQFYQILVNMANIAGVFPYYFLVIGFIAFKKRKDISHPIVMFHSKGSTYFAVGLALLSMTFAVVFNLISPIMGHQYMNAFWTFIGPIFFFVLSAIMYHFGIRRRNQLLGKE